MFKLDYTIESPEERCKLVSKILEDMENPSEKYLEILANYIVIAAEKQEKKENKKLLTDNRMVTIRKRETSYEGLVSQMENGEDGIYNLITENKQTIFQPKVTITKRDLEEIEPLRDLREAINIWEAKLKRAEGKEAFLIKKALIEMRKDQYIIKNAYRQPIRFTKITRSKNFVKFDDLTHEFDEDGFPIPKGVSLMNPEVVSQILCNYSRLVEGCWGNFEGDTWYLMKDFDDLCGRALADYPIYDRIALYKIDGMQNIEIQQALQDEFGVTHSLEYISSLWRNKIPKLIASVAEDDYLSWYYREKEKGKYKKCSRCGQIKLAHNKYFSKNKTSKDGFYSICKDCRNAKAKMKVIDGGI